MIKEMQHLSLAEAQEILNAREEKEEIKKFIKKFIKLKIADAKKLREDLRALDMLKLKEEYIVKIIDLLPEDAADLNKIFVDTSLNEDETNKVLEIVKKYK
jgi:DNA-directed RNA polymerase subunit F